MPWIPAAWSDALYSEAIFFRKVAGVSPGYVKTKTRESVGPVFFNKDMNT